MQESTPIPHPPKTVARQLARFYSRNGYGRKQNERRYAREGPKQYKKGEEIRLVAYSLDELELVQELLERAGFKPDKAFKKHAQYCQPIYGKRAVARFLEMVAEGHRMR